jgi:hypothetical protein
VANLRNRRCIRSLQVSTLFLIFWARVFPEDIKEESSIGQSLQCSAPTPPSWSWTSITSAVLGKFEAVYFPTVYPFLKITLECRAIESFCSLAGADKFGALSGGHILIEGRMIPGELKHDHDRGDIHNVSFDEEHSTLFLTDISCEHLDQLKPEPVQVLLLGPSTLPEGFFKPHTTLSLDLVRAISCSSSERLKEGNMNESDLR